MRLTVGDIARALGLTTEAIRYYVDEGLIHPIKNTNNNYWEYSSEDLIRLTDILFYRSLGLGINDIRLIFGGLPLSDFDSMLDERKSAIIKEIHELSEKLWSLNDWSEKVRQERALVGRYIIGDMPASLRHQDTLDEGMHLAEYLENSFDIEKEDWGDISISFYYDSRQKQPKLHKYLSVENNRRMKTSANKPSGYEAEVKHCLITEVHFNEDPALMLKPIISYAKENGFELVGTFYGKENTNYYIDGERLGLYKVYAPLKTDK